MMPLEAVAETFAALLIDTTQTSISIFDLKEVIFTFLIQKGFSGNDA